MMTKAAIRMGYRVLILDPDPDCPAALVADETLVAALSDADAVRGLAQRCDVLTVDTEHIPHALLREAEEHCLVRPSSAGMAVVQDRLSQREFLEKHQLPTPRTAPVSTRGELEAAVARVGTPSILKTRTGGYDGKGQVRLKTPEDAVAAWQVLGQRPCILEEYVTFEREVSVLLARRPGGTKAYYAVAENEHRSGILHTTLAPARIAPGIVESAHTIAGGIADALDHVGMMAVEMFLHRDGTLLVNEIAPRVHNSGHFTLGACATSQFEQHVRAVFDLTLGDTSQPRAAAMLNLLGDLWARGAPDWNALVSPHAHLHLYGKRRASPGRKMGHITVIHQDPEVALRTAHDIDMRLRTED